MFDPFQLVAIQKNVKIQSLLVYADDILLFKSLTSPSDVAVFQHDVDLICAWISSNYLTGNVEKSKCMLITRSHIGMILQIAGH